MRSKFFLGVLLFVFLTSCATRNRSIFLGMGVGAGTGATTGALLRGDGKGATFSALAFGVLGGLSGYFGHKSLKKRDEKVRKETIFNLEKFGMSGEKRMRQNLLPTKWRRRKNYVFTDKKENFGR